MTLVCKVRRGDAFRAEIICSREKGLIRTENRRGQGALAPFHIWRECKIGCENRGRQKEEWKRVTECKIDDILLNASGNIGTALRIQTAHFELTSQEKWLRRKKDGALRRSRDTKNEREKKMEAWRENEGTKVDYETERQRKDLGGRQKDRITGFKSRTEWDRKKERGEWWEEEEHMKPQVRGFINSITRVHLKMDTDGRSGQVASQVRRAELRKDDAQLDSIVKTLNFNVWIN